MTTVVEDTAHRLVFDAAQSRRLGESLSDPAWLAALRARSMESLGAAALPDPRRSRPWKYVKFDDLDLPAYAPGTATAGPSAEELSREFGLADATGAMVLQVNGQARLTRDAADVRLLNLGQAEAEGIAAEKLGSLVRPETNVFTALHYAMLQGGLVVEVAANAEVAQPVRIARKYTGDRVLGTPHTLIMTGANSQVTVIEDLRSTDDDIVVIPAVEVFPGPGSSVRYVVLHRWGANTRAFSEQTTLTDRDSQLATLSVVTGGRQVKSHITGRLEGRGSSSEVLGLALGAGQEYCDFYTLQDHIGADTRSDLLIKAALEGQSQSVYYGLTRVGLGARNANANQENRNLLLSKQAKADSDPVLEILTNDVIRVSHGVTAGPVDEEQLYYLQSRGISREAAQDLLVRAFLGQVLDRVPDEHLREQLSDVVEAKLRGAAG
jgi:Fe-S cluster assembly protein SufD